jgi:enamine deaminase RidA (YjgF/YER057c/UK114 family)
MISMHNSSYLVRRFEGPLATEIFAACRPDPSRGEGADAQAMDAYQSVQDILYAHKGDWRHVIHEWVHFQHIRQGMAPLLAARERMTGDPRESARYRPAVTYVGQPPLDSRLHLELAFHAVIPHAGEQELPPLPLKSRCPCRDCHPASACRLRLGEVLHCRAGNIYGTAAAAYQETLAMFEAAAGLLHEAGMSFHNVARTWIYLRDIDRDYAEFNRARRDFYHEYGILRLPASTGIAGAPYPSQHNFAMSLYAVQALNPPTMAVMTTPTLNEAPDYGSDFSRGMRLEDGNKVTLFVSGTASVDEQGGTAHVGEISGQIERMLLNIDTLLARQNATFRDAVSLTTYLKDRNDEPQLRDILRGRGLDEIPNILVNAGICREDLLCEMEVVAVRPLP